MLYFRFNMDNFIEPQQESAVIHYRGGKPIFPPQKQNVTIGFGQVRSFFFEKLRKELCLSELGTNCFYDVIEIPINAFGINDEKIGEVDGIIKFVLSEYVRLPIEALNNRSLNDLGIDIEFYKRELNTEIDSKIEMYMQRNNLKYIVEDVLWKNMTDQEKVNKFSENFIKIGSKDNELIIIDPYIFSSSYEKYCKLTASILDNSEAVNIIIVTDERNYKKASADKVLSKIHRPMQIKYSRNFHDRFWIADRRKGFYTGTSFTGIGKKISLISMISDEDVTEIVSELCRYSLIS